MTRPGIQDLIGRAMVDRDFFADLLRDPSGVLSGYDLDGNEREAILQAVAHTESTPDEERARTLQVVMMKRWAT